MSSTDTSKYAPIKSQIEAPDFSGALDGLDIGDSEATKEALDAAKRFAVSPISGFSVGALVFATSGKAYIGANMEFTGVPLSSTLHAEQSAVVNAWIHGETQIETIIVSETPCGHTRQFLWELHDAANLNIIAKGERSTLGALMPKPFGYNRSKGQSLMDSPMQPLVNARGEADDVEQRAINAASHSYAPYTNSPEGFVIESINGHHFIGRVAESLSFNPSVPAVVAALNQMNLSAHRDYSINRCTHAKLATALEHTLTFSRLIMSSLCNAQVKSVLTETVD